MSVLLFELSSSLRVERDRTTQALETKKRYENMKTALLIAALLASTAVSANAAVENLAISGSLDGHSYTGNCLSTSPA